MDLKKLLLSLSLSLPLAATGCGDDNGGGGGGDPTEDPCADVSANEEVWTLTSLQLPASADDVMGFDVDGQNTTEASDTKTPENGCGVVDQENGIDNILGLLLEPAGDIGAILTGIDVSLQDEIDNAIQEDKIVIQAVIANYAGADSGDNVTLTLYSNGQRVVNAVSADVDAEGNLSAEVSRLPITLNDLELTLGEEPVSFDINLVIQNGRIYIPAPGTSNTATAEIGGGVVYTGDNADSFRVQLSNIVDAVGLPGVDVALLDTFILPQLDLATGDECDTLSIGAQATFQKTVCEG